jgi:hypothetical protein
MRFFETPIFTRVVTELLADDEFTACSWRYCFNRVQGG